MEYRERELKSTDLFDSLTFIKERKNLFSQNPFLIPRQLDPEIEQFFTQKQRNNREILFQKLMSTDKPY